jgi:hypothetical protein
MWRNHPTKRAFQFYALQTIQPGEEICTNYGDGYLWGGGHQEVKM